MTETKKNSNDKLDSNSLGMHHGANPTLFQHAYALRGKMTLAETLLWQELRNKNLGVRFRRQHPIGAYIVDFYCHQAKLFVEVDGEYHQSVEQKESDIERTKDLEASGVKVIRFRNEEVKQELEQVLTAIRSLL